MKRLFVATIAAIIATGASAGGAWAEDSIALCGPADQQYRCGAILVILEKDATDSIADVIERLGGNPEADLLNEFQAVRDLLDPNGVADDTSAATVYSLAVPVGREAAMAAVYAADPAVYAAATDRETIGYLTPPNTAMGTSRSSVMTLFGVLLVVIAAAVRWQRREGASLKAECRL